MPSQSAASEIAQGQDAIRALLQGEPEAPTPPETTDVESAAETPIGDPDAPRILKVPVGDREVDLQVLSDDIDPESLRIGYLAEADYRRKTMELSDLRKSTSQVKDQLESTLNDVKIDIETELTALESDTDLRESDPDEYLRRLDAVQKRAKKYQEAKEAADAYRQREIAETAQREQEALMNALPSWLDDNVKNADIQRISNQLTTSGYSQDEIGSITDHRLFLLARKAALFDEITSKDLSDKRDRTPPKTTRSGAASTKADVITARERELMENHRKTGTVKSAAALFNNILTGGR